jgi:hypothetical protein
MQEKTKEKKDSLLGVRVSEDVKNMFQEIARLYGMKSCTLFEVLLCSFIIVKNELGYEPYEIYRKFNFWKNNMGSNYLWHLLETGEKREREGTMSKRF